MPVINQNNTEARVRQHLLEQQVDRSELLNPDDETNVYSHVFTLNDLVFIVPPSKISIDTDYNMAAVLHQMNVGTVQGFPGTLEVELLLGLFNYRPYGPNFLYKSSW